MRRSLLIAVFLLSGMSFAFAGDGCGDDAIQCGDGEHCCEHVIAMFSEDHAVTPPYIEGQCIPSAQKCAAFWCGNRQCSSGFFGSPSVCCVNTPEVGGTPRYSCAFNELSCPGNSQQLSIRDNQPTRTLRRS